MLTGRRILVTSGPTRAPIDAVRYVANRSSGALGSRIAVEALRRGAAVTLIAGPHSLRPTDAELDDAEGARLRLVDVVTVDDVIAAVRKALAGDAPPDAVVHAMAVLDYVPADPAAAKTPSGRDEWTVRLVRTPKVVRLIREWAPAALLVQFKLEVGTDEMGLREAALASLMRNGADLVVANTLEEITAEMHPALIIEPSGEVIARPGTKDEIAARLCDAIAERLAVR